MFFVHKADGCGGAWLSPRRISLFHVDWFLVISVCNQLEISRSGNQPDNFFSCRSTEIFATQQHCFLLEQINKPRKKNWRRDLFWIFLLIGLLKLGFLIRKPSFSPDRKDYRYCPLRIWFGRVLLIGNEFLFQFDAETREDWKGSSKEKMPETLVTRKWLFVPKRNGKYFLSSDIS